MLQEYYQVVTRKLTPGMDVESARSDVRDLMSWRPVSADSLVLEVAWTLEARYHLSWWDALIVAAASRAGCRYLLSEDLQHGQTLDQVVVLNPFESEVPEPASGR
ncbi:PIN domain-containing protein [Thioalkalivibrio thiocyanodenitrificans]|uniref:PIN domain-containing protein n=1 Tax=Thioalkalivibrio thiocyanodenitrificans TaxID=243063 RepID=UPI000A018ED4|nr:PIN domain-containing protein [Thioalkalivibrio thiocyanodenitrificans]